MLKENDKSKNMESIIEQENEKQDNDQNQNSYVIPKEKINFLEDALTDENYINSNYLVECFKSMDNKYYKAQNDLLLLTRNQNYN